MHYISYASLVAPYAHPRLVAINNQETNDIDAVVAQEELYPPVNTERLNTSAQRFHELMVQANLLIDKIISSNEFSGKLMKAAQLSKTKEVEELILSTGISIKVETKFTPSGINFNLKNSDEGVGCCDLLMTLNW